MQPWLYAALHYFVMNDFTVQTEVFTCVNDSPQSQKKIPSATSMTLAFGARCYYYLWQILRA